MQMIIECDGTLISLTKIYEDYARPKCKSPKRVIRYRNYMEQIEYEIIQSGYLVDKVIQYTPDGILVNGRIAMSYLNLLDVKSYFHFYFGSNGILKTGNSSLDSFFNYYS
jgi:hypothetical protein